MSPRENAYSHHKVLPKLYSFHIQYTWNMHLYYKCLSLILYSRKRTYRMPNKIYQTDPSAHEEKVSPVTGETEAKDTHTLEQNADKQANKTLPPVENTGDQKDITLEATQAMPAADKARSLPELFSAETTQAALMRINKEDTFKPSPSPVAAKLPKRSRAAAAQRMGEVPLKASPGVSYEGSHHLLHDS